MLLERNEGCPLWKNCPISSLPPSKYRFPNLGVSNTVRGAMASWAKTLATELGEFGITVNSILPGFINTARIESLIANKSKASGHSKSEVRTEMEQSIPAKRFGEPGEIADFAAFLCSPSGAYINGTSVRVDGGKNRIYLMNGVPTQNFINGEYTNPIEGDYLDNYEPGIGQVYSQIPNSTQKDLELAIDAAEAAFPIWSTMAIDKRRPNTAQTRRSD